MKRISSLRYLVNNKKKIFLLLLIISVAVFCIATIMTLISSVYSTCEKANVDVFNNFSIIGEPNENVITWLSNNDDEAECYEINLTTTNISTVLGSTSSYIIAVDDDDMEKLLHNMKIKCSNGKIPVAGHNEILVNEYVARNKKLKVGDKLGEFKVSGMFNNNTQVSFCYKSEFETMFGEYPSSYLVTPTENGNIEIINKKCSEWKQEIDLITKDSQKENLEKEFETINLIMNIIVVMVSISLSIAVAAFVCSNYSSRTEEFAIYYAIGYGVNNITQLVIEETVLVSAVAYVIGNLFSIGILKVVDMNVYKPLGQMMKIVSSKNIIFTLIIPILVILFSIIPVILKLVKTDLLMLIERR